jgi:hypothetical protein
MDLWDVAKLIVRRWAVSVPMLLLTAAALVWTGSTVTPNYTAQGNILLLPPSVEVSPDQGQERAVNPWDTDSLTGAVITLLRNQSVAQQLVAEGHTGTWEAERDVQFWTVVNIEVTAPTAGEAQATIQRLSQLVAAEVSARQQGYGLTEGQQVGTVTLGAGENVEIARGNQMRALIVVFFAGAILTVGVTIGVDALLRKRTGERVGQARITAQVSPAVVHATVEAVPLVSSAAAKAPNGAKVEPAGQPAGVTGDRANPGHPNQADHVYIGEPDRGYSNRSAGISVSYRATSGVPAAAPDEDAPKPPAGRTLGEDSTIILPLSGIKSAAKRDDRGDRDDEDSAGGPAESRWH